MTTLRALRTLLLGETWLLPLGVSAVIAGAALLVRPWAGAIWPQGGGFVVLAGVAVVLLASVARTARRR